jgi:hypothetical protein
MRLLVALVLLVMGLLLLYHSLVELIDHRLALDRVVSFSHCLRFISTTLAEDAFNRLTKQW